jgi:undecaprenyl diphosphate synthase
MSAPVSSNLEPITSPSCVGFIMDGNRRFARAEGLPQVEGHRRGYEKLKEVIEWCRDADIQHAVVYALSSENWSRAQEEIAYLMDLFRLTVAEQVTALQQEGVAVHFVGELARFPEDLQTSMARVHAQNNPATERHLWIAASYGGRSEILSVCNRLSKDGVAVVDEQAFEARLWTAGMPDPDLVIRTGGEHRVSNFLSWQTVYSELFFIDTFWPAFTRDEFTGILEDYAQRDRRRGK